MDRHDLSRWLDALYEPANAGRSEPLTPDGIAHLVSVDGLWLLVSLDEDRQCLRFDALLSDPPDQMPATTLHRELLRWNFDHPYDLQHLQFALAADGTAVCHGHWTIEPETPIDTLTEPLLDWVEAVQDAWCQVCAQGLLALATASAHGDRSMPPSARNGSV
jgi:hypothetical protein